MAKGITQDQVNAAADELIAAGISTHVIGGADVAAELDAKRAIDSWFVPGRGPGVKDAASAWTEGRLTDEARGRISALVAAGRTDDARDLYADATGASATEARAIIRSWDPSQDY